jgi:hypothetical protein
MLTSGAGTRTGRRQRVLAPDPAPQPHRHDRPGHRRARPRVRPGLSRVRQPRLGLPGLLGHLQARRPPARPRRTRGRQGHGPAPTRWRPVLRDAQHADALLCRLVAHHSCAIVEAGERGRADVPSREFEPAPDALSSVLTFCDMTTSPDGEPVPAEQRLAEIQDRYGPGRLVSRSIQRCSCRNPHPCWWEPMRGCGRCGRCCARWRPVGRSCDRGTVWHGDRPCYCDWLISVWRTCSRYCGCCR